jgi:hypothetical protein
MSMKRRLVICGVMIILSGCTAASSSHRTPSPSPSAAITEIAPSATPTVESVPSPTPTSPSLETSTDPYLDAGTLLDGVCFEYLLTLDGQVWTWSTPAELSAFYDRVEASEVCPDPVARQGFDFSQGVLVGTVSTATGCDAAHRVVDTVRDDRARTQTLVVELVVRPGCPYELVQPLLVAVPDVPDGYALQIAVSEGDTP